MKVKYVPSMCSNCLAQRKVVPPVKIALQQLQRLPWKPFW